MNSIRSARAALARPLMVLVAFGALTLLSSGARADTVPYTQPTQVTYGPPYTSRPGGFTVAPAGSPDAEYQALIAGYKSFYGAAAASCGFPISYYPAPHADGGVAQVTYTSPCGGGNQIFATIGPGKPGSCPNGYTPDQPAPNTTTCSRPDVSITAGESLIGAPDIDDNHHVQTMSQLTLIVTKNGQPDPGALVFLQSDRGSEDQILVPFTADANGNITGDVYTHDQPGGSTITTEGNDVNLLSPGQIDWLPARYQETFDITCYVLSLESDFLNTPLAIAPGVNNQQFHQGFITDVKLQGTGQALDGRYLHYQGNDQYRIIGCPLTNTGACANDGATVAVDQTVVPRLAFIDIDSIGERVAQDTGGAIKLYHIDVYFGTRRAECLKKWGHKAERVKLVDYVIKGSP